ncbi:hypothetical protein ACOSQ2_020832 [Xanthoceras sorbifolium]
MNLLLQNPALYLDCMTEITSKCKSAAPIFLLIFAFSFSNSGHTITTYSSCQKNRARPAIELPEADEDQNDGGRRDGIQIKA